MTSDIDLAIKKIAKGSGAVFVGTVLGMILGLTWRLVAIRIMTPHDFGVFFLGVSILNLLVALSTLGLPDALPRYIAYFRARKETAEVAAIIRGGVAIVVVFSVFIVASIFFLSSWISSYMSMPDLATVLWIMAISIPFLSLALILTAVFRAYGIVKVKVYFVEIFKRLFILIGLVALLFLGINDLISVSIMFSISGLLVFFFVVAYYLKNRPSPPLEVDKAVLRRAKKNLILFSIPLLGMGFMDTIFMAIPPTMLGIFGTAEEIAAFGAGITVSRLVGVAMTSLNFLYLPLMSDFFARNMKEEMREIYSRVSKWALLSMVIVIVSLFFLSEQLANSLFGSSYSGAGDVIVVQALGFFSLYLFGPVRATLIVIGKPYFLVISSSVGLVVSLSFSIILIPTYAAVGASASMAIGLLAMYALNALKLHRSGGLSPFSPAYTKTFAGGMFFIVLAAVLNHLYSMQLKYHIIVLFVLSGSYLLYLLAIKALGEEDIELLRSLVKKARRS